MAAPIYNPPVPCVQLIPGGLSPGRLIRVQGSVPGSSQRFAINLQCGPNTDPRDDIALHLNFRFVERCVVRNNLSAMNWGPEETQGGMPLSPGAPFEALVLCEGNSFKVALNGQHFCQFDHRLPFQRISHITIDGEVQVQTISFEGSQNAAPPAYGGGAPPAMYQQQPGYGAPQPGYGPPMYGQQPMYGPPPQGPPMYYPAPGQQQAAPPPYYEPNMQYTGSTYAQPQRRGMGTGAAVGLGVGALAAGGLAGYALGGGFSSDSPEHTADAVQVASFDEGGDFGGDDWMD